MKALIARKLGMTSIINEKGAAVAVTLLRVDDNIVTQVKTDEKDGYNAIQMGAEEVKKASKSVMGHLKPAKVTVKIIREFRTDSAEEDLSVGTKQTAEVFSIGDDVTVVANSKGKGFAGTIKRHNFNTGPKTHGGQSYRRPGSIGSMFPQKIFKGKKMAGRMGNARTTVKNLKIAMIDMDNQVIAVTGAVPGPQKGIVLVKGSSK